MTATVIRAQVAGDGRLLSADAPLLALQREAGAEVGDPLAVPQLAAIARLSHRLGVMVSRSLTAAADHADISMWVRAKPEDGGVHLAIIDWRERLLSDDGVGMDRSTDIAALSEGWIWQVDTQLRFEMALAGAGDDSALPQDPPAIGARFSSYFQLQPDEDGDMAMLRGFALRQAFRGQHAILSADPARRYSLSAAPLFDVGGGLTGYRGIATPLRSDPPAQRDAPLTLYPAEFGRRLDRSLRQPLGRIIANADTISAQLEGPLRDDYAGYASDIASAGRHLLALVDDLADLQAVDRPDFSIVSEELDLADIARRAAGLLAVKALDKSITILPPQPEETLAATGEFRRVLQILVNLVGNAVRYAPEGTEVRIWTEWEDGMARLTVADQGSGVDPADRERIFDKFERLGRDDHGGSGLGLYISRRLARAMGGDIVVGGAPGQGARFILTLPVAAS
ncbi:sensor histidine kinase [Sphingobium amiense]|uniref:histidine kinase n=1 Tax=Sphingobium amiense TaxID=135719 RepID=A0A494WC80_9SPHN|nr:HAMP domain-containing sensor histidine kinase [Sphingobium amiense]BBD97889.1 sensor histidine kinase [Sphingobium amiense]